MKIKPIKPTDISPNHEKIIPDVVIQAVNTILQERYRGGTNSFTVKQDDIIKKIIGLDSSLTRSKIFEDKMLDFEDLYRKNGWDVKYDKPAYNETYDAFFEFKPKLK